MRALQLARVASARLAPAAAPLRPALSNSRPAAPLDPHRPFATASEEAPRIAADEKVR